MKEKLLQTKNGVPLLFATVILGIVSVILFFIGINSYYSWLPALSAIYLVLLLPLGFMSIKSLKGNEAIVFTLFGKYYGTIRGEGLHIVNPFVQAFNPTKTQSVETSTEGGKVTVNKSQSKSDTSSGKRISLKVNTLNNGKQKVNDSLGNPIEIGVVVLWKVVDTAMAVYEVDNYFEFLSIQADSVLRNIVRNYPYDLSTEGNNELTLRGSSLEVADQLRQGLQEKVNISGLEISEVKITHLAYAPEIAASMLQRQQASAVIDARKLIVEGAVGMVKMALNQLKEEDVVILDDERKAAMVSNLLVVLCGNKDPQPIINSGSIY